MSELQAAEVIIEDSPEIEPEFENVLTEPEQPEEVSELAPDEAEKPKEKVTFSEEQQTVLNDAINKQTWKRKEAEREAERNQEALKQEVEELRAKLPQESRPSIPDIPDPYSENYEDEVRQRDAAIREASTYDARKEAKTEATQKAAQDLHSAEQREWDLSVNDYINRAIELGISKEALQTAGQRVLDYGINEVLIDFIVKNEKGPLITTYLQNNPAELEALSNLSPIQAAIRIENVVKDKALASKAKPTSTPDPHETLTGAGVANENPATRGMKFE